VARIICVQCEPADTNLADMLTKIQLGSKRLELAHVFVCVCFNFDFIFHMCPGPSDGCEKFPAASSVPSWVHHRTNLRLSIPVKDVINFRGQLRWIRASPKLE